MAGGKLHNGRRTTDNGQHLILGVVGTAIAVALVARAATAAPVLLRPHYRIEATLAAGKPQIEGTLEVAFTNHSSATLQEAVFFLFPNRFSAPDPEINDFQRQFVYPGKEFDAGNMQLLEVRDGGSLRTAADLPMAGLPPGTVMRVPIADLAPGATRRLTLRFTTAVPHRFGSFGEYEGQLTLVGGWYPYLASLDASGQWATDAPPALADFDVTLSATSDLEMVLNGRYAPPSVPLTRVPVPAVHYLSLIAAPHLRRAETIVDGTRIVLLQGPQPWAATRVSPEPSPTETLLAALREVIAQRPAGVPPPPPELVVVDAPLRLDLTAAGEGDVIVSDRMLKLAAVLRPFHELQLAQAVYAELLRPALARREPPADYYWVSEGVSFVLAERFMNRINPQRRTVYDWIELFNVFAIVDRFETVPKIPFAGAFFPRAKEADPLHAQIMTFNNRAPPGRVVLTKLREQLGAPGFDALLDQCLQTPEPLRGCAIEQSGDPQVAARLADWTAPYPAIDYRVDETTFNRPEGEAFRSTVTVRRVSSRPFAEPVTVRLHTIGGADVDLHWKSGGDVAIVSAATPSRVYQAVIDPDRKLIDDDRSNNAWPPRFQVVVDSADVEVSSTEFGLSALAVARMRYDYRKDLAVAGFYTNRGIGFSTGARLHWGEPVDPTRFRNNLYAFYTFAGLNGGFKNDADPEVRTTGQLGGIGFRYDYTNVYWTDDPSRQRHFRIYGDYYDPDLGSDYRVRCVSPPTADCTARVSNGERPNYGDWGYTASGTVPVWSPRTIAAAEIFNGFSTGFVPNQGLYSLGGSRSIRGIGAEDQLARNIFVLRTELRQEIPIELDLNLLDLLVLRRTQIQFLLDTGRVSNSAGRIYDVSGYACGIGVGFAAIYEFLGFFPAAAYIELATRIDEPSKAGDVQFLFGSTQAF